MDFQVLIAESAIADLKEIVEFVAQDDGDAARHLGHKLIDQALTLRTFPTRFPFTIRDVEFERCRCRPFLFSTNAMR